MNLRVPLVDAGACVASVLAAGEVQDRLNEADRREAYWRLLEWKPSVGEKAKPRPCAQGGEP